MYWSRQNAIQKALFREQETGMAIVSEDSDMRYIRNCLMVSFENKSYIEKEDIALLEPFAARLNIKLTESKSLQNIDNARRSMMKFFSK